MSSFTINRVPGGDYMNQTQKEFFESVLRARLGEVADSTRAAKEALAGLGIAADALDQGLIEEERNTLYRTLERLKTQSAEITRAIQAIKDDEYGWCEDTGEEIGLERLIAQPTAKLSAAAQARTESAAIHFNR
jgi:DnaK suppressor protein